MRKVIRYDRLAAAAYAETWALGRNPAYGDFSHMGGDCANFASQCLKAGWKDMARDWYYRSMRDRTPSWSSTRFLRAWLLDTGRAEMCSVWEAEAGDLIVLWNGRRYYHTLVVLTGGSDPLVAAHTHDARYRALSSYAARAREALHILDIIEKL